MVRAIRWSVPALLALTLLVTACSGKDAPRDEPPAGTPAKVVEPEPPTGTDGHEANPAGEPSRTTPAMPRTARTDFFVESPTIPHHGAIPKRHSCDGEGVSPALRWENAPAAAKSFALVVDDPDGKDRTFVHWVLFNIPAETHSVPENLPAEPVVASLGGAKQGTNGAGKIGWDAICPEPGRPHRIVFRLYAVDQVLDLKPGASRGDVESALKGHYLGQSAVIASYARTAP